MSTPPPPPAPPPPFSQQQKQTTWDRRTLREQRRAAALAARQQQRSQRMQMRAMRRQSLLGPLMLVSFGVLFLLIELGTLRGPRVLAWLAHWWPTLLLGAGLVLLAEWAADTWVAGKGSASLPRRTLGPGASFMLVIVAIVGISAMGLQHGSDWMRQNFGKDLPESWSLEPFLGQHLEFDRDLSASLDKGDILTVSAGHGSINVTGDSADGAVHVRIHERLVGWPGEDLRRREDSFRPTLAKEPGGLHLALAGQGRDRADITIQVPHESGLVLGDSRGDVNVSELRGPLKIGRHTGDIVLTGLTGRVEILAQDDNASITGHSLSGDISVSGRSGDLTFSDVTGTTSFQGDFFGTTHLERVKGSVHFQSSFTNLSCEGIPGELTIQGRSELQGDRLNGPVSLTTSDRDIELSGLTQGANVTNRNGSVSLSFVGPLGSTKVSTSDGSVTINVPDRSPMTLSASTSDGEIKNGFGLNATQEGDRSTLSGQLLHGGPAIELSTSNGDITIQSSRGTQDAADDPGEEKDGEGASGSRPTSPHLHLD